MDDLSSRPIFDVGVATLVRVVVEYGGAVAIVDSLVEADKNSHSGWNLKSEMAENGEIL